MYCDKNGRVSFSVRIDLKDPLQYSLWRYLENRGKLTYTEALAQLIAKNKTDEKCREDNRDDVRQIVREELERFMSTLSVIPATPENAVNTGPVKNEISDDDLALALDFMTSTGL